MTNKYTIKRTDEGLLLIFIDNAEDPAFTVDANDPYQVIDIIKLEGVPEEIVLDKLTDEEVQVISTSGEAKRLHSNKF